MAVRTTAAATDRDRGGASRPSAPKFWLGRSFGSGQLSGVASCRHHPWEVSWRGLRPGRL